MAVRVASRFVGNAQHATQGHGSTWYESRCYAGCDTYPSYANGKMVLERSEDRQACFLFCMVGVPGGVLLFLVFLIVFLVFSLRCFLLCFSYPVR